MNTYSSPALRSAVGLGLLLLGVSSAHATGQFRTYISSTGLDTNSCALQKPCRLLPAALAATAPGGEVWMLDSANFNTGTVTITQSVTLLAVPGAVGSVVANGGDAIDIPTANLTVTLRNLLVREIDGAPNQFGVYATGANTQLVVEGSEFSGLNDAVYVTASGTNTATITQSVFRGNNTAIDIEMTSADAASPNAASTAAISSGSTHGIVDHCLVTNSGSIGVYGVQSQIVVSNSTVANTVGNGIYANTNSIIRLENDVIQNNSTGAFFENAGVVQTSGNNTFAFNASDGTALTTVATK